MVDPLFRELRGPDRAFREARAGGSADGVCRESVDLAAIRIGIPLQRGQREPDPRDETLRRNQGSMFFSTVSKGSALMICFCSLSRDRSAAAGTSWTFVRPVTA